MTVLLVLVVVVIVVTGVKQSQLLVPILKSGLLIGDLQLCEEIGKTSLGNWENDQFGRASLFMERLDAACNTKYDKYYKSETWDKIFLLLCIAKEMFNTQIFE